MAGKDITENANKDITKGDELEGLKPTKKDDSTGSEKSTPKDTDVPELNFQGRVTSEDITEKGYHENMSRWGGQGLNYRDYGNSSYDESANTFADLEDLNEVRAREQSGIAQIGAGIVKGGAETLNTAVGNIVGTVVGLAQGIDNAISDDPDKTFFNGIWKNSLTELQDSIRKSVDEALPVYRSKEEQNMGVVRSFLTASGFSDLLESAGFTSGMLLSTYLTGGMGVGSAASSLLRAAGASEKAVNFAYRLISGIMGSVSEASMEGLNGYNDVKDHYSQEINSKYDEQLNTVRNHIENEIWNEMIRNNPSLLTQNPTRDPALEESIRQRVTEKYADAINVIEQNRENELQGVESRALSAGTMIFGLNMGILGVSNTGGSLSFLKAPSANAEREVKKSFLGSLFKKSDPSKPLGEGISAWEAKAIGIREGLMEGFEESNQKWASNLAEQYYGSDYDPDATNKFSRFLETAGESFKTTYSDPETWKEWLSGAVMGLTGTFNPAGIAKALSGEKIKMSDFWQGGVVEAFREGNKLAERSQKAYNEMNELVTNKKLQDNFRLGVFNLASKQRQMEAAARGDKFNYENENDGQTIRMIQTFANAGELNTLSALIGNNQNMSDEELNALCEGLCEKNEKKYGDNKYHSEYSFLLTDNGERISDILDNNDPRRKEAKEKIAKESKRIQDMIRTYQKAINEADAKTGYQLEPEKLNFLAWGITQLKNWEDRIKSMYSKDEFQKVYNKLKTSLAESVANGESVQSIIDKLRGRLGKQQDTEKINSGILEDLNKELGDLESQREYLEKYTKSGKERKRPLTKAEKARLDELDKQISSKRDEIRKTERRLRDNKNNLSKISKELSENKNISDKGQSSKEQLEQIEELAENHNLSDIFELMDSLAADSDVRRLAGKKDYFNELISLINNSDLSEDDKKSASTLVTDMLRCVNASTNLSNLLNELTENPNKIQAIQDSADEKRNEQVVSSVERSVEDFAEELQNKEVDIEEGQEINEDAVNSLNFRILNNEEQKQEFENMLNEAIKTLNTNLKFSKNWTDEKINKHIDKILNKIIKNVGAKNKEFAAYSEAYRLSHMLSNMLEDVIEDVANEGTFDNESAKEIAQQLIETLNIFAYSHGVHPVMLNRRDVLEVIQTMGFDTNNPDVMAGLTFVDRVYRRLRQYLKDIKQNGHITLSITDGKLNIIDSKTSDNYFVDEAEEIGSNDSTRQGVASTTRQESNGEFYRNVENSLFASMEERIQSEKDEWGLVDTNNPPVNPAPSAAPIAPITPTQPQNPPVQPQNPVAPTTNPPVQENGGNGEKTGDNGQQFPQPKPVVDGNVQVTAQSAAIPLDSKEYTQDLVKGDIRPSNANKYAIDVMNQNKAFDFINSGKLNQLVKSAGHVPVFLKRDRHMPNIIYLYVKIGGKLQMIGFMEDNSSNKAKSYIFGSAKPFEGPFNSDEGYIRDNNDNVIVKNIEPSTTIDDIPYVDENKEFKLKNKKGEELSVVNFSGGAVGARVKDTMHNTDISTVDKKMVGTKPIEQAIEDGDVLIAYGNDFIGRKGDFEINTRDRVVIVSKSSTGENLIWETGPISLTDFLSNEKDGSVYSVFVSELDKFISNIRDLDFGTDKGREAIAELFAKFVSSNIYNKGFKNSSFNQKGINGDIESRKPVVVFYDNNKNILNIKVQKQGISEPETVLNINIDINPLVNSKRNFSNEEINTFFREAIINSILLENQGNRCAIKINKDRISDYKPFDVCKCRILQATNLLESNVPISVTYQNANESIETTVSQISVSNPYGENNTFKTVNGTYYIKRNSEEAGDFYIKRRNPLLNQNVAFGEGTKENDFFAEMKTSTDPDNLMDDSEFRKAIEFVAKKRLQLSKVEKSTGTILISLNKGILFDINNNRFVKHTIVNINPNKNNVKQEPQPPIQPVNPTTDVNNEGGIENGNEVVVEEGEEIAEEGNGEDFTSNIFDNDDAPFREINDNTYSSNVSIREGQYVGYTFAKEFVANASSYLGNTDRRLLDFVLSNVNRRLVVKVLPRDKWSEFRERKGIPNNVRGLYSTRSNIEGSDVIFLEDGSDITTILHELTHAATVSYIRDVLQREGVENNDISDIRSIINELRSLYKSNKEAFTGIEGIENFINEQSTQKAVEEFVAEAVSNNKLQNLLKKIKTQNNRKESRWDRFKSWFRGFLKKHRVSDDIARKMEEYTLFDKFSNATTNLVNNKERERRKEKVQETAKKSVFRAFNRTGNNINKDRSIVVYDTKNVDYVDYENVDISGYLHKYDSNGNWSDEFSYMNKLFETTTGKTFDINDKSEYGKKTSREFYEFLIEKGYKGLDMASNNDLSNTKYSTDSYIVSFGKEYISDKQIGESLNVNPDELTEDTKNHIRNCE